MPMKVPRVIFQSNGHLSDCPGRRAQVDRGEIVSEGGFMINSKQAESDLPFENLHWILRGIKKDERMEIPFESEVVSLWTA